jgi:hypothetical protein
VASSDGRQCLAAWLGPAMWGPPRVLQPCILSRDARVPPGNLDILAQGAEQSRQASQGGREVAGGKGCQGGREGRYATDGREAGKAGRQVCNHRMESHQGGCRPPAPHPTHGGLAAPCTPGLVDACTSQPDYPSQVPANGKFQDIYTGLNNPNVQHPYNCR